MFAHRIDAGQRLASALAHLATEGAIIYGLPRGGVPVAAEVARALAAPLDVILVRKIGAPNQPELALGAIVDGAEPIAIWNEDVLGDIRISKADLAALVKREEAVIARRRSLYSGHRPVVPVKGRTAIVVDDGLATGATALAAVASLRHAGARRVVLAAPVAPADALDRFRTVADEVVVLELANYFPGVGAFYRDFSQTSDDEVVACLDRQRAWLPPTPNVA